MSDVIVELNESFLKGMEIMATMKVTFKTNHGIQELHASLTIYRDFTPAIELYSLEEGPYATATVNLAAYGYYPAPGCVIVKDYSENAGMVDALLEAGVIKNRGRAFSFGHIEAGAFECELSDEMLAE